MELHRPNPPNEEQLKNKDSHQRLIENLLYEIGIFFFDYLEADDKNQNRPFFELFHHENAYPIQKKDFDAFIKSAKHYQKLWNCAEDIEQWLIQKKIPIPQNFAKFRAYQIKYPEKKPKGTSQDPIENLPFKRMILIALDYAVKKGLSPTRNDESSRNSACDIVSAALYKVAKINIDYSGIRKLKDRESTNYSKISTSRKLNRFPR